MTILAAVGADNGALVERALGGDQTAWNELVHRYTRLVWHVIHGFRTLNDDDKSDVHQTVWLRLAERLDTVREPDRIGSWLATTARNECIRSLRSSGREVPDADAAAEVASLNPTGEERLLDAERDQALWAAFGQLRAGCQQLLRLLIADPPFSYDEITEILDIPRGSIGPTRQRCLDQLRHAVESEPESDSSPS